MGRYRIAAAALLCASGCALGGATERLEARLRVQEDKLLQASARLEAAEREAADARRTIAAMQAESKLPPPTGETPTQLAFASLLTGGVDEDGRPGDEAVRAVIQPLTDEGSPVRAAGTLEVELLDVAAAPEHRVRGRWSFEGEALREQWDAGLFASGYTLELAPDEGPLPDDALLIARFRTPDGRQVEATRSVTLRPDAAAVAAATDFGPSATQDVRPVSAVEEPMPESLINADFPGELPMREPPAEEAGNPFADFETLKPVRTSDVWTDATLPVVQ